MKCTTNHRKAGAFTFVETLVGATISSAIILALMLGSVALLQTFKAAEDYSDAAIDQARILDYIARDVRRATSVAVAANPAKLTLTLPDQYANAAPSRTFRTPSVSAAGVVYGSSSRKVAYFLTGKDFVREEEGVRSIIARDVADFAPIFDTADPAGKMVESTITFAPRFQRRSSTAAREGTTMTNRAFLRNK